MIHARPVTGRFRSLRSIASVVLIAILVAIPWIRIGDEPLVLLDIAARRFHVFGLVIFPQELFFLWLIVAGAAIALFLFTALLGRLWCGWACPQTIFTDLFAGIGRFIQGHRGRRAPAKVATWRVALTHVVWFALSAIVAFHLVAYFVSPYELIPRIGSASLSPTVTGFLVVMILVTYVDFAIVRQAFCKYLCPYARFQTVLMDRDSLVVGYDTLRGEPRGKKGTTEGDCVDCGLCVQVCPTGIDIRDGLQLECIACTQCIDACDGVMDKLGRDPGLIAYRSLVGLERKRKVRIVRPRVIAYALLLATVGVTFVLQLAGRQPWDLSVSHNRDQLVATSSDGRVGNAFTLHIENRSRERRSFRIAVEEDDDFELIAGINPITVEAASSVQASVFVMAQNEAATRPDHAHLVFVLEPEGEPERRLTRRSNFIGMGGNRVQ